MAASQSYVKTAVVQGKADEVLQHFVTATAGASGYTVTMGGTNTIILTRKFTPTWAIVVAIIGLLFFLLGLLALLVKETETLTVSVSEADQGVRVSVSGQATAQMIALIEGAFSGRQLVDAS